MRIRQRGGARSMRAPIIRSRRCASGRPRLPQRTGATFRRAPGPPTSLSMLSGLLRPLVAPRASRAALEPSGERASFDMGGGGLTDLPPQSVNRDRRHPPRRLPDRYAGPHTSRHAAASETGLAGVRVRVAARTGDGDRRRSPDAEGLDEPGARGPRRAALAHTCLRRARDSPRLRAAPRRSGQSGGDAVSARR